MTTMPVQASGEVLDRIIRLSRALQARGFAISLAETIDAARAATCVDLAARPQLRVALRATLVKGSDERGDFDALFDRYFPARVAVPVSERRSAPATQAELATELAAEGDLADLAAGLVEQHAGLEGEVRGERHHLQRVLRAADLARLMGLALREDPQLSADEVRARIEELKRLIADEIRDRIGSDDELVDTDVESIEFLNASRAELERMRQVVRPLARQVAARLSRRRQHRRSGRVDMRRTMRRSLSTGGVPFDLAHHRRAPHHPELWVLCDISGSVAEFSLFTLTLMASLSAELPRTRSFVFVDAVDEITSLLQRTGHAIEPWQIMRNTNVIGASGHSDYGAVLAQFWDDFGERDLRPTSTVIITGDARSNHQPARSDVLAEIARRARSVYWLNPEPRREWAEYDSEMPAYADHCTATFEVRDLHQLAHCVERIL